MIWKILFQSVKVKRYSNQKAQLYGMISTWCHMLAVVGFICLLKGLLGGFDQLENYESWLLVGSLLLIICGGASYYMKQEAEQLECDIRETALHEDIGEFKENGREEEKNR